MLLWLYLLYLLDDILPVVWPISSCFFSLRLNNQISSCHDGVSLSAGLVWCISGWKGVSARPALLLFSADLSICFAGRWRKERFPRREGRKGRLKAKHAVVCGTMEFIYACQPHRCNCSRQDGGHLLLMDSSAEQTLNSCLWTQLSCNPSWCPSWGRGATLLWFTDAISEALLSHDEDRAPGCLISRRYRNLKVTFRSYLFSKQFCSFSLHKCGICGPFVLYSLKLWTKKRISIVTCGRVYFSAFHQTAMNDHVCSRLC